MGGARNGLFGKRYLGFFINRTTGSDLCLRGGEGGNGPIATAGGGDPCHRYAQLILMNGWCLPR